VAREWAEPDESGEGPGAPVAGRVLVLDDDADVGATIAAVVESAGLEALVTSSFLDFVAALDAWQPSHVTIDLAMPDVDGIEVLRRLARRGYDGIVIISSGLDRRVLRSAARSARAHGLRIAGYLPKPFRAAQLHALLADEASSRSSVLAIRSVREPPRMDAASVREALRLRRFEVVYQPKITCATGAVAGFEALARWYDPDHGVIMPTDFIPAVEAAGLIDEFTDQVVETALSFLGRHFGDSDLTVSINLSGRSLHDLALADRIEARCREAGMAPGRVILEVTETSPAIDQVAALDVLTRFRIKGLLLSIDDFGTGHATLAQLARQPFSELKIARQFVVVATRSVEARTILRAMVNLGHGLGLQVAAEGVEDEDVFALLRTVGCDLVQGFRVARPMSGDELVAWMDGALHA
jgi:EAL domain-containing protein (putative c-di-GMP-specific phosphodiesterase class I)/ActR/RegA family two-component response regulator